MTEKEFFETRRALLTKYDKELNELNYKFATEHSPAKVGDVVTDHLGSIRVESIRWSHSFSADDMPYCVYIGPTLRKDSTLPKKREERKVFQINLVKKESV